METTRRRTANALRRPFETVVKGETTAGSAAVYDTLANLESHRIWGSGKNGLRSLTAPPGLAHVGTEFESTGNDPMGTFQDRSVVTEARPGELFEFVTDAVQRRRKGEPVEWTLVHRYEITARQGGSEITYTNKVTRLSRTPGPLKLLNSRLLGGVVRKMTRSVARAGLSNLIAHVEDGPGHAGR